MADNDRPSLYICKTCNKAGSEPARDDEPRDGQLLYEAVAGKLAALGPDAPVDVVPISKHRLAAGNAAGPHARIASPGSHVV